MMVQLSMATATCERPHYTAAIAAFRAQPSARRIAANDMIAAGPATLQTMWQMDASGRLQCRWIAH